MFKLDLLPSTRQDSFCNAAFLVIQPLIRSNITWNESELINKIKNPIRRTEDRKFQRTALTHTV